MNAQIITKTAAYNALMREVLQPREAAQAVPMVQPVAVKPGSIPASFVTLAADKIRKLYNKGLYQPRHAGYHEYYAEACAETGLALFEAETVTDDKLTLGLIETIFRKAGFYSQTLRPTTLEAQVMIQMTAIEAARNAQLFMAEQQTLAFN